MTYIAQHFVCLYMPLVGYKSPLSIPLVHKELPFVCRNLCRGFTMVELMVVIAIAAILATLAFPSFRTLMQNQRLGTQANEFIADLNFAKSEAVKRVGLVGVCVSSDGATCTGGSWEAGRVIFADVNNDGAWDGGDLVLRIRDGLAGNNTLRPSVAFPNDTILFSPRGALAAGGGATLAVCDSRGKDYGKAVVINAAGQARVDTGTPASCY